MRIRSVVTLLVALTLAAPAAFASPGASKTVTLEGKVVCAKCSLHEEGREKCQNVLLVEKEGRDEALQYYLVRNEVYETMGDVCMSTPKVRITGKVDEKDGRLWLSPEKIERVES